MIQHDSRAYNKDTIDKSFSRIDSKFVSQHKTCHAIQIGGYFLVSIVDALFKQQMNRFNNDDEEKRFYMGNIRTYFNTAWKNEHWYFKPKNYYDLIKVNPAPPHLEGAAMRLMLPIEITDEDWGLEEVENLFFSFDILSRVHPSDKKKKHHYLRASNRDPEGAKYRTYDDFIRRTDRCRIGNLVCWATKHAQMKFLDKMQRWEGEDFFDRVSAARTLSGLTDFLNNYIREYASTSFMKFEKDNLNIMINCDEEDQKHIIENQPRPDQIRFGTGQNIFDFIAPYSYELNAT